MMGEIVAISAKSLASATFPIKHKTPFENINCLTLRANLMTKSAIAPNASILLITPPNATIHSTITITQFPASEKLA